MRARPHDPWAGIAIAVAGALGLWADLAWPWLLAQGPEPGLLRTVLREEMVLHGPLPYERALLEWPLACWALCIGAGAAAACLSRASRPPLPLLRRWLWGAAAAAGFVVLLTGMRWLGFYLARLWDSGASPVHLHVVPYLHLALGAAVLAVSLHGLQRGGPLAPQRTSSPPRLALASAWLFGLALLALPLLPFASVGTPEGRFHYDELSVAVAGQQTAWSQVASTLAWVRGVAWCGLALALAGAAAASWAPRVRAPRLRAVARQAPWSLVLPAAAGAALAVRLPMDILAIEGAALGPNLVPQAAFAGALALLGLAAASALRGGKPKDAP